MKGLADMVKEIHHEEKDVRQVEMETVKAHNVLGHEDLIQQSPATVSFQRVTERADAKVDFCNAFCDSVLTRMI